MKFLNLLFLRIGQLLLILLTILSPWFLGAVQATTQVYLFYGVIAVLGCSLLTLWTTPAKRRLQSGSGFFFLSILPLILLLGLGWIQTVPFSAETVRILSPRVLELKEDLLPAPGSGEEAQEKAFLTSVAAPGEVLPDFEKSTLSVDSEKTCSQLAVLIMIVSLFISAGILFQDRKSRFWLIHCIALNGVLIVLVGLAGNLGGKRGLLEVFDPGCGFIPYINPNNAAGYLCMCCSLSFGLLVYQLLKRRDELGHEVSIYHRAVQPTFFMRMLENIFDWVDRRMALYICMTGILAAGVFCTVSRGGMIAVTLAMLVGLAVTFFRRRLKRQLPLFLVVFIAAVGFVYWFGMNEKIGSEVNTIVNSENYSSIQNESRWDNWHGAWHTAKDYRWCGSGLGTYSYANRPYDIALRGNEIFAFAENVFVQTTVEGGWPMLILLFVEMGLLLTVIILGLRTGADNTQFASAVGMLVFFISLTVASSFDFGIYMPANGILLAVAAASFFNQPGKKTFEDIQKIRNLQQDSEDYSEEEVEDPWDWDDWYLTENGKKNVQRQAAKKMIVQGAVYSPLILLMLFFSFWGLKTDRLNAVQETVLRKSDLVYSIKDANFEDLLQKNLVAVKNLRDILQTKNSSAETRIQLARLLMIQYQIRCFLEQQKENSAASVDALWNASSPESLLRLLLTFEKTNMEVHQERLRNDPLVKEIFPQVLKEVFWARRLSLLNPDAHVYIGLVLPIIQEKSDDRPDGSLFAKRAYEISPQESRIAYYCGVLMYLFDDKESAFEYWKSSLIHNGTFFNGILSYIVSELKDKKYAEQNEIVHAVFPSDYQILNRGYMRMKEENNLVGIKVFLEFVGDIFDSVPEQDRLADFYYQRGHWHLKRNEPKLAVDDWEQALIMTPKESYMFELASFYEKQGQLDNAKKYFSKLVRKNPVMKKYKESLNRVEQKIAVEIRTKELSEERIQIPAEPKSKP